MSQIMAWLNARSVSIHESSAVTHQETDITTGENHKRTAPDRKILWLYGPAGAGKSAIAQTLSEDLERRQMLAASFFFSQGNGSRGITRYVFITIAYQLALALPEWYDAISKVVNRDPAILSQSLELQFQKLIVEPLQSTCIHENNVNAHTPSYQRPFVVVIDGLDECANEGDQCAVVRYISDMLRVHDIPLTFLIASRSEPHIRHLFEVDSTISTISNSLFLEESDEDIEIFLRDGFHQLRQTFHQHTTVMIDPAWPSDTDIKTLIRRSSGYFIYASTVLKFLNDTDVSPQGQLTLVLTGSPKPFTELDDLYRQILRRVRDPDCILLPILECIRLSLSISSISIMLGVQEDTIFLTLRRLHSLLRFTRLTDYFMDRPCIVFSHNSFNDFLANEERSGEFYLGSGDRVCRLVCLPYLKQAQRKIADGLDAPLCLSGTLLFKVVKDKEDQDFILDRLRAICEALVLQESKALEEWRHCLCIIPCCHPSNFSKARGVVDGWAVELGTAMLLFKRGFSYFGLEILGRHRNCRYPTVKNTVLGAR